MTFIDERAELCRFGLELAHRGIVARTWGNLSRRMGESMLITPSGIAYEDLRAQDIVEVAIADLSWSGPVKPSSEKDLHATVYRACPGVGAIFHTHQNHASAWAAARMDLAVKNPEHQKILGTLVPCADYALPTTTALAQAVGRIVKGKDGSTIRALLLANHGAVCFGSTMQEALDVAEALEACSKAALLEAWRAATGLEKASEDELLAHSLAQGRGKKRGIPA